MEFFTGVSEAGVQRHDREYGLTAFSIIPIIEADPNQDIGLMEFFSPGYEAISGVSKEAEVLPTIDPADRKFFTPRYGTQMAMPREAEPLSTIDPADRKFFTPGYGHRPQAPTGLRQFFPQ